MDELRRVDWALVHGWGNPPICSISGSKPSFQKFLFMGVPTPMNQGLPKGFMVVMGSTPGGYPHP